MPCAQRRQRPDELIGVSRFVVRRVQATRQRVCAIGQRRFQLDARRPVQRLDRYAVVVQFPCLFPAPEEAALIEEEVRDAALEAVVLDIRGIAKGAQRGAAVKRQCRNCHGVAARRPGQALRQEAQ